MQERIQVGRAGIHFTLCTQSAQISQKQDGYNTYVIIARLSPKSLCNNSSTWAHDLCDVQ